MHYPGLQLLIREERLLGVMDLGGGDADTFSSLTVIGLFGISQLGVVSFRFLLSTDVEDEYFERFGEVDKAGSSSNQLGRAELDDIRRLLSLLETKVIFPVKLVKSKQR